MNDHAFHDVSIIGWNSRNLRDFVGNGQFKDERGPLAGTVAVNCEATVHLFCRQGAAVQAEAMTVLFGSETVGEDTREVLRRDAYSVVPDGNRDHVVDRPTYKNFQALLGRSLFVHGIFGIAHKVG
jgi:hypothetical protein